MAIGKCYTIHVSTFRINNAYTNTVDTEKDGFKAVFSYCSKNSSVSVLDAFSSSSCLKRIY